MGEGSVFTGVCYSVYRGGSAFGRTRGLPFDWGLSWGEGEALHGGGLHGGQTPPELRSTGGRYASYWNAYLFTFACCAQIWIKTRFGQCVSKLTLKITQVTYTYQSNPDYPYELINMAVILQLQEGQEVWVRPNSMGEIYGADSENGMYSWFCGHLVYAL